METKTIYLALLEAQKEIETIKKDATAGTSFKYNYATLGAVMEEIKEKLTKHGLFLSQPIKGDRVVTTIYHSSGESISDEGTQIICAKPNDPQAQGSAISYARRYGIMSLLCLSAEDDDGVKAMPHASPAPPQQTNYTKTAQSTTPQKIYTFKLQTKEGGLGSALCGECNSHMFFNEGISKAGKAYTNLKCEHNKDHIVWYPKPEMATNWNELNEMPTKIVDDIDYDKINDMPF
jgi:hypothetical protein